MYTYEVNYLKMLEDSFIETLNQLKIQNLIFIY